MCQTKKQIRERATQRIKDNRYTGGPKKNIVEKHSKTIYIGRATSKFLSQEQVEYFIKNSGSNTAASRLAKLSPAVWKKYASMYTCKETGKTLYEKHAENNKKGRKTLYSRKGKLLINIADLLSGKIEAHEFNLRAIKYKIIQGGFLAPVCFRCGFKEKRVSDGKIPLILYHKDGEVLNYRLENLEFICYNCAFLYKLNGGFDGRTVSQIELLNKKFKDSDAFEIGKYHRELIEQIS